MSEREPIEPVLPVFEELDLSEAWDTESMREILINRLKELNIYREGLLYRGFDGSQIEVILKEGRDNQKMPELYAAPEKPEIDGTNDVFNYFDYNNPAVAIYSSDKLLPGVTDSNTYVPKPPYSYKDALLAVFKLKY